MPLRICLIIIAPLIAAGFLTGAGVAQEPAWQRVTDAGTRFSIEIPSAWLIDQKPSGRRALATRSPEPAGVPPDTVDVWVNDSPFAISPSSCGAQMAFFMRMVLHQWTTLDEGEGKVAGQPAFVRDYIWRLDNEEHRSRQVCVSVGRRTFVLIGTTLNTPARRADNLPIILRILDSFRPAAVPAGPEGDNEPRK